MTFKGIRLAGLGLLASMQLAGTEVNATTVPAENECQQEFSETVSQWGEAGFSFYRSLEFRCGGYAAENIKTSYNRFLTLVNQRDVAIHEARNFLDIQHYITKNVQGNNVDEDALDKQISLVLDHFDSTQTAVQVLGLNYAGVPLISSETDLEASLEILSTQFTDQERKQILRIVDSQDSRGILYLLSTCEYLLKSKKMKECGTSIGLWEFLLDEETLSDADHRLGFVNGMKRPLRRLEILERQLGHDLEFVSQPHFTDASGNLLLYEDMKRLENIDLDIRDFRDGVYIQDNSDSSEVTLIVLADDENGVLTSKYLDEGYDLFRQKGDVVWALKPSKQAILDLVERYHPDTVVYAAHGSPRGITIHDSVNAKSGINSRDSMFFSELTSRLADDAQIMYISCETAVGGETSLCYQTATHLRDDQRVVCAGEILYATDIQWETDEGHPLFIAVTPNQSIIKDTRVKRGTDYTVVLGVDEAGAIEEHYIGNSALVDPKYADETLYRTN